MCLEKRHGIQKDCYYFILQSLWAAEDKEKNLIWYREGNLFLEFGSNQKFRKVGAYLLPPVMSTNSASWLCQECPKIQGLDATTAPGLHPEVGR